MAESARESIEEIILCSICLETLKQPVILPCLHHFCKSCQSDHYENHRIEQEGVHGILCPVCQQFASIDAIKDDFVMDQIVNLHFKKAKDCGDDVKCEFCFGDTASYKCFDCKSELCDTCKKSHLQIPMCKGHTIKSLEEVKANKLAVNTVVFCVKHPDKIIEFNCIECKETICYKCHILTHRGHSPEAIESAIEKLMPIVNDKSASIENDVAFLQEKIENLNELENRTTEKKEELFAAIDQRRLDLNSKLEINAAELRYNFQRIYTTKIMEIQSQKSKAVNNLSTKQSVQAWTKTQINILEDVNLLLVLHGDLMNALDQHQQQLQHQNGFTVQPLSKELKFVEHEENMIAILKEEDDDIPDIYQKARQLQTEVDMLKVKLCDSENNLLLTENRSRDEIDNLRSELTDIKNKNTQNEQKVQDLQSLNDQMRQLQAEKHETLKEQHERQKLVQDISLKNQELQADRNSFQILRQDYMKRQQELEFKEKEILNLKSVNGQLRKSSIDPVKKVGLTQCYQLACEMSKSSVFLDPRRKPRMDKLLAGLFACLK